MLFESILTCDIVILLICKLSPVKLPQTKDNDNCSNNVVRAKAKQLGIRQREGDGEVIPIWDICANLALPQPRYQFADL